jgi:predicted DNA-binding transcriptional regulator AlpA
MCSESTVESELSYLTVEQLAQRLQVSESTIYGWAIGITFRSSWQEIS